MYRSEMHVACVWVRFGLMLEAYCRGSQEHMKALARQVGFMTKLRATSEQVRLKNIYTYICSIYYLL